MLGGQSVKSEAKNDARGHEGGLDHNLPVVNDCADEGHGISFAEGKCKHQVIIGRHFPGQISDTKDAAGQDNTQYGKD